MRVLHISDLHYRRKYEGGNPYEDMLSSMDSSFLRMQKIIEKAVQNYSIERILLTGDICDEGSAEEYRDIRTYLDSLSVPVMVCLGNHDIKENFYAGWLDEKKDAPYMQDWLIQGIHWVSFDNAMHGMANGYIDEQRLKWLDKHLEGYPCSVILMHHQLQNEAGIPGLPDGENLRKVLKKHTILAVFNGHTHWVKHCLIDGIPYFTAPSLSFQGMNLPDGSLIFSQSQGYSIYDIDRRGVQPVVTECFQERELATWKF